MIVVMATAVVVASASQVLAQTSSRYPAFNELKATHSSVATHQVPPSPAFHGGYPAYRWGYFGARHFAQPAQWHRSFTGEIITWKSHR
jgi:hypothetical protein